MTVNYRIFLATITAMALSNITAAQASNYLAIDASSVTVTNTGEDDINPRGFRARLGVRVSEVFDLEAHFGSATDDETEAYDELNATYMGLYLKGYLPVGQRSALFALAGGASVELTQTLADGKFSDDRSGFSYGFGLETELSRALDLSADYTRYSLDDDNFSDVSAVNIGLKWYF